MMLLSLIKLMFLNNIMMKVTTNRGEEI